MVWYKHSNEQLFELLESSPEGLSGADSSKRLKQYGRNELAVKHDPWWKVVIEPFRSVFVGVLVLAAVVSLLSGERLDAIIVAAIVGINAIIFYTQQYATTRVLASLKRQSLGTSTVRRGGAETTVSSALLVPGDIVLLHEGERIPADARVLHTDNLQANESSLTGESVPVHKHASVIDTEKPIYEQDNMVFAGSYVLGGTAVVMVVETGSHTEFGKIAELSSDKPTRSPVQDRIDRLISLIVQATAAMAVLTFILALTRGIPAGEALRFVLSLTVAAVPEGLPVALTVIIVLGMRRMAKKRALVRSFKAIEDVGLVTVIATDKTGTLTKNHLTVAETWAVPGVDVLDMVRKTIEMGASQSDPLDRAIAETAPNSAHHPVEELYPFDIKLRLSGAYHAREKLIYLKGSPEHVLAQADLNKAAHHEAESAMHELAAKGYRVIAVGTYVVKGQAPADLGQLKPGLIKLAGYVALADELRPEAAGAIAQAHSAGIGVKLITGDHFETAFNIGRKLGLAKHPSEVARGDELPKDVAALADFIKDKTVFARILPEDKYRILQALKTTEIAAMTGDGVNDVPALASAHVGFAMGSGSDIAKDAGGIVLMNDKFTTIIKAVAEGRRIYDNIRKMLYYLLSTSMGEILTMTGALMLGLPLPVTAIQILWINLVCDTSMVLPLGLEPAEDNLMKRPPRKPTEPILDRLLVGRMLIVAATMAAVALGIVAIMSHAGRSQIEIHTVAFMALIAAQWVNAFNARSEYQSLITRSRVVNRPMLVGFSVAFVLQMIVMFGPLQSSLDVTSVPLEWLGMACGAMLAAVFGVVEVHKWAARRER